MDRINYELKNFIESIKYNEYSRSFKLGRLGGSFNELNKTMNKVISDLKKFRAEREEQYHYLLSIIQHVDTGIIAYTRNGDVELINRPAKKLLKINHLNKLQLLPEKFQSLVDLMLKIETNRSTVFEFKDDDEIVNLTLNATEIKLRNRIALIVTIKDIQNVLEQKEMESWQKLIRVLTHEIMNSITPISSLSGSLVNMIENTQFAPEHQAGFEESYRDIKDSLQTIHKRSVNLIAFVEKYRQLTKIPQPIIQEIDVKSFIEQIQLLFQNSLKENHIKLIIKLFPGNIRIRADEKLIEQVLINIIKNAIESFSQTQKNKIIEIKGFINPLGRKIIEIADNGEGIMKEVIERIFIPFFTTKPNGSGIGLSLARQIMLLHGGNLRASSIPGQGTSFTIIFKS